MGDEKPTYEALQAMLPEAAIERRDDGELVIYTGWATNPADETGPLIDWCYECDSTADLRVDEVCSNCQRPGTLPALVVVPDNAAPGDGGNGGSRADSGEQA